MSSRIFHSARHSGGREGRRAARRSMRRPIVIYPAQAERTIGRLHDYSAAGVGFTVDIVLSPGQEFTLNLVMPDGARLPLTFSVVYCKPDGAAQYHVGARRIQPDYQTTDETIPVRHVAAFSADQTKGFSRGRTLDGRTVCGWERQLDLHRQGNRVWLNMHPPGKSAGWGMFVDRQELITSLEALVDGEAGTVKLRS